MLFYKIFSILFLNLLSDSHELFSQIIVYSPLLSYFAATSLWMHFSMFLENDVLTFHNSYSFCLYLLWIIVIFYSMFFSVIQLKNICFFLSQLLIFFWVHEYCMKVWLLIVYYSGMFDELNRHEGQSFCSLEVGFTWILSINNIINHNI